MFHGKNSIKYKIEPKTVTLLKWRLTNLDLDDELNKLCASSFFLGKKEEASDCVLLKFQNSISPITGVKCVC